MKRKKKNSDTVKLDTENLKKLFPVCLGIGAGLWALRYFGGFLGGLWSVLLLAAWVVSGGLYANAVLKSGSSAYAGIAVNGAIVAAISGLIFGVLSSVVYIVRTGMFVSLVSVSTLLEAIIVGALAAVAWYAYRANPQK